MLNLMRDEKHKKAGNLKKSPTTYDSKQTAAPGLIKNTKPEMKYRSHKVYGSVFSKTHMQRFMADNPDGFT